LFYVNLLDKPLKATETIFKLPLPLIGGGRGGMGKKKVISERDIKEEMVYPSENDVLGIVEKLLGYDRVLVRCQDGHTRVCRIRGKMKRRTWIREGDVVLVSPWDFQYETRGDIFWRYTQGQVDQLRKEGILKIE